MAITHVIAHHVERLDNNGEARFTQRDSELPLDGKVEELLRELKRTFCNRTGKAYGQFSDDIGSYPFSSLLKNYLAESLTFASFTQQSMAHFKVELEKDEARVDAHLLMCEEKLADANYLYLFMVDHDEALFIDGDLTVKSTFNIGSLMLGARVNLDEWQTGAGGYLSLLRLRGDKPLTDAFFNLVGFADQQMDIMRDTNHFLEVVDNFSRTLPEEQAQQTRNQVVDYCIEQDKSGEPVVFEKLSQTLSEEQPQAFVEFVEQAYDQQQTRVVEEQPTTPPPSKTQLIPHRARLKQYLRLSGRDEEISLSFNAECLGNSIEYDHERDTLILKQIPKALRSKLLQHLRNEQERG